MPAIRQKACVSPQALTPLERAAGDYFGWGREAKDTLDSFDQYPKTTSDHGQNLPPLNMMAAVQIGGVVPNRRSADAAPAAPVIADALTIEIDGEAGHVTGTVLFNAMAKIIKSVVDPLRAEIAELKRQLEAKQYKGVWERDKAYSEGNSVTHDGSTWTAIAKSTVIYSKPGDTADWQLSCKRGRDGRDGRDAKGAR